MKCREIYILYGLPGSGKTTWAKEQPNAKIIDCDNMRGGCTPDKIGRAVRRQPSHYSVIIDGLITTQKALNQVILAIDKHNGKNIQIFVEYWKKDIGACLKNDATRPKERQATKTINRLAAGYKKPKGDFVLTEHEIEHDTYMSWWEKYNLKNPWRYEKTKHLLYSNSWSLGGSSRGLDGEIVYSSPADPAPDDFKEFDLLIEQIKPDITFLQYKRIRSECVTIVEEDCSDYYYDGSEAHYVCDLRKLYDSLYSIRSEV